MASIVEITITHGRTNYRVSSEGTWFVLMWGTFGPEDAGRPRYKWIPIEKKKVPPAVIIKSREVFG